MTASRFRIIVRSQLSEILKRPYGGHFQTLEDKTLLMKLAGEEWHRGWVRIKTDIAFFLKANQLPQNPQGFGATFCEKNNKDS